MHKNKKINKFLIVISFFLISCFYFKISAAETSPVLNLKSTINEALANNPQIKAAHKRYEAGLARVKLLRTLADPRFEYEYDKIVPGMIQGATGDKMSPMRTFSVSQEFPFPTKLFLRRQGAQIEAESLKQEYKEKENEVIQRVKETYLMLSLSNKEIQITQDTKILLDQLIRTLTNRYSVGQATQQEVLKAQSEYSKLDNQVILLEQRKAIAQAMLKSLLNRPQGDGIPDPPAQLNEKGFAIDKTELVKLMKDNRPELKSFRQMVKKSAVDYSLAKQEYLPDFMVKYTREQKDGSAGNWAGMLGVTVPIWFWEKQSSFVKEAKAQLEEMESEYQGMENMVGYEVEAALAKVEAQRRLAELYETSFLPQAEAAFKASTIGFEAGKNDFLNLLDSERMLLEFKLDYAQVIVDLEIAYADLERAVGIDLKLEK